MSLVTSHCVALHLTEFHNVDLFRQGIYFFRVHLLVGERLDDDTLRNVQKRARAEINRLNKAGNEKKKQDFVCNKLQYQTPVMRPYAVPGLRVSSLATPVLLLDPPHTPPRPTNPSKTTWDRNYIRKHATPQGYARSGEIHLPAVVDRSKGMYCSSSFRIRFVDEKVLLNEMCVFALNVPWRPSASQSHKRPLPPRPAPPPPQDESMEPSTHLGVRVKGGLGGSLRAVPTAVLPPTRSRCMYWKVDLMRLRYKDEDGEKEVRREDFRCVATCLLRCNQLRPSALSPDERKQRASERQALPPTPNGPLTTYLPISFDENFWSRAHAVMVHTPVAVWASPAHSTHVSVTSRPTSTTSNTTTTTTVPATAPPVGSWLSASSPGIQENHFQPPPPPPRPPSSAGSQCRVPHSCRTHSSACVVRTHNERGGPPPPPPPKPPQSSLVSVFDRPIAFHGDASQLASLDRTAPGPSRVVFDTELEEEPQQVCSLRQTVGRLFPRHSESKGLRRYSRSSRQIHFTLADLIFPRLYEDKLRLVHKARAGHPRSPPTRQRPRVINASLPSLLQLYCTGDDGSKVSVPITTKLSQDERTRTEALLEAVWVLVNSHHHVFAPLDLFYSNTVGVLRAAHHRIASSLYAYAFAGGAECHAAQSDASEGIRLRRLSRQFIKLRARATKHMLLYMQRKMQAMRGGQDELPEWVEGPVSEVRCATRGSTYQYLVNEQCRAVCGDVLESQKSVQVCMLCARLRPWGALGVRAGSAGDGGMCDGQTGLGGLAGSKQEQKGQRGSDSGSESDKHRDHGGGSGSGGSGEQSERKEGEPPTHSLSPTTEPLAFNVDRHILNAPECQCSHSLLHSNLMEDEFAMYRRLQKCAEAALRRRVRAVFSLPSPSSESAGVMLSDKAQVGLVDGSIATNTTHTDTAPTHTPHTHTPHTHTPHTHTPPTVDEPQNSPRSGPLQLDVKSEYSDYDDLLGVRGGSEGPDGPPPPPPTPPSATPHTPSSAQQTSGEQFECLGVHCNCQRRVHMPARLRRFLYMCGVLPIGAPALPPVACAAQEHLCTCQQLHGEVQTSFMPPAGRPPPPSELSGSVCVMLRYLSVAIPVLQSQKKFQDIPVADIPRALLYGRAGLPGRLAEFAGEVAARDLKDASQRTSGLLMDFLCTLMYMPQEITRVALRRYQQFVRDKHSCFISATRHLRFISHPLRNQQVSVPALRIAQSLSLSTPLATRQQVEQAFRARNNVPVLPAPFPVETCVDLCPLGSLAPADAYQKPVTEGTGDSVMQGPHIVDNPSRSMHTHAEIKSHVVLIEDHYPALEAPMGSSSYYDEWQLLQERSESTSTSSHGSGLTVSPSMDQYSVGYQLRYRLQLALRSRFSGVLPTREQLFPESPVLGSEQYEGVHVCVLVHGYQGSAWDMRLLHHLLALHFPRMKLLSAVSNQGDSDKSIATQGVQLAQEVAAFIQEACMYEGLGRLSFVAHSMGGLVVRAALQERALKNYVGSCYTLLTLASPHTGYVSSQRSLLTAGMWFLRKWTSSSVLSELSLSDGSKDDLSDTLLFKLSNSGTLGLFRHLIFAASRQDRYVPFRTARLESSLPARPFTVQEGKLSRSSTPVASSKKSRAYEAMIRNLLLSISPEAVVKRLDVSWVIDARGKRIESFIGRTAHIHFLDRPRYFEMMLVKYKHFFL